MNRENELNKQFPLEDGTTYIQSLDKSNEPTGAGGESIKENFIDSSAQTVAPKQAEVGMIIKYIRSKILCIIGFVNIVESNEPD